jgi:hypothetical protein
MNRLRSFFEIVIGLLRELSDQNAYRRHLEAHGLQDTGSAWRQFSSEHFRAKFVRPKCC